MASGGNLSLIQDSSDEDSDEEKASMMLNRNKKSNAEETQKMKPASAQNVTKEKIFSGLQAKQLLTFYEEELKDKNNKLIFDLSHLRGKEQVKLTSSNQTLLATKKQELEKLLEGLKYKTIEFPRGLSAEIDDMIQTRSLKILLCRNEKPSACYRDESEIQKFEISLKHLTGGRKTEQKKKVNRRDRDFDNAGPVTPVSSSVGIDTSGSELNWQSSANVTHTYDLGENAAVNYIIKQNGVSTKLYRGSIIRAKVDAIVNAANERLDNCGGVAAVISKAAGNELEKECRRKMGHNSKLRVSENLVTTAGNLPCNFVIHAVGPRWDNYMHHNKEQALEDLYKTVVNILKTACDRKMKCVVMPPISSGIFGVPKQACAAMYIRALRDFSRDVLPRSKNKIEEFHIVDMKDEVLELIFKEYDEGHKRGGNYLEPSKVLERLGLASRNFSNTWGQNISNFHNSPSKSNSSLGSSSNTVSGASNSSNTAKCILTKTADGRDEFLVGEKLKVFIYQGNIMDLMNINVLVCSEGRNDRTCQGYLAKQIMDKITEKQRKAIASLFKSTTFRQFSDVLQSHLGVNHYNLILFAIIKKFPNDEMRKDDLDLLWKTTLNVLEKANKKNVKKKGKPVSVALPLLGTGSVRNSEYIQKFADVVCSCILNFSKQMGKNSRLTEIHLVNHQLSVTEALKKAFCNPEFDTSQSSSRNQTPEKRFPNRGTSRSQFDPSKYDYEEIWHAVDQTEIHVDDFIEVIHQQRKYPQETKIPTETSTNNGIKGNISIIESSDEETEVCEGHEETKGDQAAAADDNCDCMFEVGDDGSSTCVVCMDEDMEDPVILKTCRHQFCRDCIKDYFSHKPVCPVCNTVYGTMFGNQPKDGTATVYRDTTSLPGFSCPTIIIDYQIPNGVQTEEHPNPGESFTGVSRQAYFPDNEDGRMVLELLKHAFEHRLTFTVGFSRTSGKDNVVTWNDIHHKTRRDGGPEKYGYPDPEYIERLKEELAAKGIS